MLSADRAVGQPPVLVQADEPDMWIITSGPVSLVAVRLFYRASYWWYEDISQVLKAPVQVLKTRQAMSPYGRERYYHDALQTATDYVVRLARYRWKEHFNPAQRLAMGQQKCPMRTGATLCRQTPMVGTVWCQWHRFGVAIR